MCCNVSQMLLAGPLWGGCLLVLDLTMLSLVMLAAMFCEDCSCRSCMNTLDHADLVQRHRQTILARSPQAFDAKVQPRCPCYSVIYHLDPHNFA